MSGGPWVLFFTRRVQKLEKGRARHRHMKSPSCVPVFSGRRAFDARRLNLAGALAETSPRILEDPLDISLDGLRRPTALSLRRFCNARDRNLSSFLARCETQSTMPRRYPSRALYRTSNIAVVTEREPRPLLTTAVCLAVTDWNVFCERPMESTVLARRRPTLDAIAATG